LETVPTDHEETHNQPQSTKRITVHTDFETQETNSKPLESDRKPLIVPNNKVSPLLVVKASEIDDEPLSSRRKKKKKKQRHRLEEI
jgi:hypothetical protein